MCRLEKVCLNKLKEIQENEFWISRFRRLFIVYAGSESYFHHFNSNSLSRWLHFAELGWKYSYFSRSKIFPYRTKIPKDYFSIFSTYLLRFQEPLKWIRAVWLHEINLQSIMTHESWVMIHDDMINWKLSKLFVGIYSRGEPLIVNVNLNFDTYCRMRTC